MPLVQLPECAWCNTTEDVHLCRLCDKFTCWECYNLVEPDECFHISTEFTKGDPEWKLKEIQQ